MLNISSWGSASHWLTPVWTWLIGCADVCLRLCLLCVQVYTAPAQTFKVDAVPAPVFSVPVMAQGRAALEEINAVSCAAGDARGCL